MNINSLPVVNDPVKSQSTISPHNAPTLDEDVKKELRNLGEPITYFGEDSILRRERLIKLLEERPHTRFEFAYTENDDAMEVSAEESEDDEDFYTPGSEELLKARMDILKYSNTKASARINSQKKKAIEMNFYKVLKHRRNINSSLEYEQSGTQVIKGNTRAISAVRFSKNDKSIACGSWDGSVFILGSTELETKCRSAPGYHSEKASALDWNMESNIDLLVTGGNEGNINFWDTKGTDSLKLKPAKSIEKGHKGRITKTLFHPSGRYIASTSFDQTWKLWDVEKNETELYQQEGHSKEIFCGAFHPDGGLFTSGGLDGIIRVWDLRSGRAISTLQKHSMGIYSTDWSPNGYHFVSASGDCSVKVWDLRKLDRNSNEIASIPAHTKLASDVRYFNRTSEDVLSRTVTDENEQNAEKLDSNGTFLVSSSYDGLINIWSSDNWAKVHSLKGHNDKVMSCDISSNGSQIVSSGWDRTVKLWSI